jgi:hypothetical protein
VELLVKIVGYLNGVPGSVFYERPPVTAPALANAARVSRLFYELVMPLLWEEVHLWGPRQANPSTLLKYPRTRVFRFIRKLHLSTSHEAENMNKKKLNKQYRYLSKCLEFLNNATHVKSLRLHIDLYNVDDHPREFRIKLEAINSIIFHILRHSANMELDEFGFHPGNETALSSDVLRIIERKLTEMRIGHLECGMWVDRLHHQERLTSIEVHANLIEPAIDLKEYERNFWTAIALLDYCKKVYVSSIPIPLNWNVKFQNITDLNLMLFFLRDDIKPFDWISSFTIVFQYMPRLEHLCLSSNSGPEFQSVAELLEISNITCIDLKTLNLDGYFPRKLLVTIGSQCPKLSICCLGVYDINDEDLRALSQCQRLVSFSLDVPNRNVTKRLAYLTDLPQLATLNIDYSFGKHIDAQLLYDLARYCPRLNIIRTNDRNRNRAESEPRLFETEDIAELFAAGAELRAYFEATYREPSPWDKERERMKRLDEYLIRIDHLRRDKELFLTTGKWYVCYVYIND